LGAIIAFIFYIFKIKKDKRIKKIIILIAVIAIVLILTNEYIYDIVINNILLNNKNTEDLNDISSGRMEHLTYFLTHFKDSLLIGRGNDWVESFPLNTLLNYGILGAIPLFILWLFPLKLLKKQNNDNIKLRNSLILIYVVYMTNSIFEALAPFGPGVKCYMLWLICGLYVGNRVKNNEKEIDKV